jgi:hypothetical protein
VRAQERRPHRLTIHGVRQVCTWPLGELVKSAEWTDAFDIKRNEHGTYHVPETLAVPLILYLQFHRRQPSIEPTFTSFQIAQLYDLSFLLVLLPHFTLVRGTYLSCGEKFMEFEGCFESGSSLISVLPGTGAEQLEFAARLRALWLHLKQCSVLVVPSVLLMPGFKDWDASCWYQALSVLESELSIKVFPRINVEMNFECKEVYMKHLHDDAPRMRPYAERLQAAASGADAPLELIDESQPRRSANIVAPTIFVSVEDLSIGKLEEIDDTLTEQLKVLKRHTETEQFQRTPVPNRGAKLVRGAAEQYLCIKGCQGTRNHAVLRTCMGNINDGSPLYWPFDPQQKTSKSLKDMTNGKVLSKMMVLAAPPHAADGGHASSAQRIVMIQPALQGLAQEFRLYFHRGDFTYMMQTEWTLDKTEQNESYTVMEFRVGWEQSYPSTVLMRPQFQATHILPQLIDFALQVLEELESRYQAVSQSALLRPDLGVEHRLVPAATSPAMWALAEAQLLAAVPADTRDQWQCSGFGFIFRIFLSEVTSSLDINTYAVSSSRCSGAR